MPITQGEFFALQAAPIINGTNTINVCAGVRLPNSAVTTIVQPLTTAVGALQTTTNSILGNVLSLNSIAPISTNIASLMGTASTGYTTLQAVSTNGTTIGTSASCYSSASGFTLAAGSGLSIGGNAITGLGDPGLAATAGELGAIAFGNNAATETGAVDAVALGAGARVAGTGSRAIAIGAGASAAAANSLALGAGASANRGAQAGYTAFALTGPQTSVGEVSVGSLAGARQITNVAAGSADGDAVNVAQLTAVAGSITSLSGLTVQYGSGARTSITLAGGATGTAITNLAPGAIAANSREAVNGGQLFDVNTAIGRNSSAITALNGIVGGHTTALTTLSAANDGNTSAITTLQGVTSSHATVLASLDATAATHTGQITTLTGKVDANATSITGLTANLASSVAAGTATASALASLQSSIASGSVGPVRFADASAPTTPSGTASQHVTLVGTGGGAVALHNLGTGSIATGSTDAVNGGQLFATNTLVTSLSGRVDGLRDQLDASDLIIADVRGQVARDGARIDAVAADVADVGLEVTSLRRGALGPIRYSDAVNPILPNGGTATQHLTLLGDTSDPVGLHNLAGGVIARGSTDAVNGDQLFATNGGLAALTVREDALAARLFDNESATVAIDTRVRGNADGLAAVGRLAALIEAGGSGPIRYADAGTPLLPNGGLLSQDLTLIGSSVDGVRLHNLADGRIFDGSTDAVNGGQLFDTDTLVATLSGRIDGLGGQLDGTDLTVAAIEARVTRNSTEIDAVAANVADVGLAVTSLRRGSLGPVRYSDATRPALPNGGTTTQHLTLVGDTSDPVGLHNLADGVVTAGSTDAVNGGQLDEVVQNIAVIDGRLTFTGRRIDGVGTALDTLGARYDRFSGLVRQGGIGPVQYSFPTDPTVSNGGTPTQQVTLVGGAAGAVMLHNVAGGVVASGSTDAVNGGQLFSVLASLGPSTALSVLYDDAAQTRVTLGVAGGVPALLTNVASGRISALSTDAVNGSQLFVVDQELTRTSGRVATLDGRMSDIATLLNVVEGGLDGLTTGIARGDVGPVRYADASMPALPNGGGPSQHLALVGRGSGAVGLHNVAAGQVTFGSTDAVNGSQLFALGQDMGVLASLAVRYDSDASARVTFGMGGGAPVLLDNLADGALAATSRQAVTGAQLFATDRTVSALAVTADELQDAIADTNTANFALDMQLRAVGDELGVVDGRLAVVERGGSGPARYADASTPTVGNGGMPSQDVTLIGASDDPVRLHNLADGAVTDGSTDAVNGGQLFRLHEAMRGLAAASGDAVTYDDAGRTSVSLRGSGGAAVILTNVATGRVADGSTDAINGGQLNDVVRTVDHRIAGIDGRIDGVQLAVSNGADAIIATNLRLSRLSSMVAEGGVGLIRYSTATDREVPNGGVPSQDMTVVGASPGPVGFHNIAPGRLEPTSLDAVNGSQVARFGQAMARTLGNYVYDGAINALTGGFRFAGNDYGDVQSVFDRIDAGMANGQTPSGAAKYFHANSVMSDSSAQGKDSTAIGPSSNSSGVGAVAMGRNASASSDSAVAIGDGAQAVDGKAVSIGMGNMASGDGSVAIGDPNVAAGNGAIALGKDNEATGLGATAVGNANVAAGRGAAAIGDVNVASGTGAAAIGSVNSATGEGAIAIGSANIVAGNGALAIGSNIHTIAHNSLAIGSAVTISGDDSIALGNEAVASGASSAAVGTGAVASGFLSGAFGLRARATERYSLALGPESVASEFASTALGTGAASSAFAAVALGTGSIANEEGSVALGSASQTVRGASVDYVAFGLSQPQSSAGEIAVARNLLYMDGRTNLPTPVGNRQITGVAAGAVSSDAVNVAQLHGVAALLGTALSDGLGAGATFDIDAVTLIAPSFTVGGSVYRTVGDAIAALDRTGRTVESGQSSAPVAPGTIVYDDRTGSSVTLAVGGTVIRNVADGATSEGSTDAMNGGQLAAVSAEVSTLADGVMNGAVGAVRYVDGGGAPAGRPTNAVALSGKDASTPVALGNVAAGRLEAGSTDAVNADQLAATNRRVAMNEATATSAQSLAEGAVRYDGPARTAVTLGDGNAAVAIHNVADAASARDAVNLGQLAQAAGVIMAEARSYIDGKVARIAFDLDTLRKDAHAATAGALALAGMPQPYEAGRGMLSMGAGTYQGQSAIALGLAKALADEHTVVKVGATYNSRGQVGANAGVGYQF